MKVTRELLDPCTVKLNIEADAAEVSGAFERAFRRLAEQTRVPGFRPGKAPRAVVAQYVDQEDVRRAARQSLAQKCIREALKIEQIQPYVSPEANIPELTEDEPASFEAVVALAPVVELGDLEGLSVYKPIVEVTDIEVDAGVERVRSEYSRLVPVTDRTVEATDVLTGDLGITVEGDEEPAVPRRSLVRMGKTLPGLDDALLGQAIGEERRFSLQFPEDYHEEERAGKNADFVFVLDKINEPVLPEVTDEWVATISPFQNVADWREGVRADLMRQAAEFSEDMCQRRAIEAVMGRSTIEVSSLLVQDEAYHDMARLHQALERTGQTYEAYLQRTGQTEEQHWAQMQGVAYNRLRTRLMFRALATKLGLTVTDEEISGELAEAIANADVDDKTARRLSKSQEQRRRVGDAVAQRKLHEALFRVVTVTEGPASEDPTYNAIEAADAPAAPEA